MKRLLTLVVVAACGGDDAAPPGGPDYSCDAQPDPHCAHPIDRLVIPRLRELGSRPRDASADEVCRRMAIDLIGRAPNDQERAACRTQTVEQMADTFLGKPEFVRTQRRAWGELAKYESLLVWSPDLADLDGLVSQLYRGTIAYADFVKAYVVHPGFYGLHPDDSWTANLFSIFLGRPARQDEIDSARPLTQVWAARAFAGREVFWNFYKITLANGGSEAQATQMGNDLAYNGAKIEWGINTCRCTPSLLDVGCFTEVFGELVVISPYCIGSGDARDPVNFFRLAERTPTDADDLCPDNVTHRPECSDRGRGATQTTFTAFAEWAMAPQDIHDQLRQVGDALVVREDLWEAAVDRELRKLLGWWQATFKHPDSDMPEVRALLVKQMHDGAGVRDIIKLIVTSQLYVQPAAAPADIDATDLPPWLAGPSKLLGGESWLQSAAIAVGETGGSCDFRWGQASEFSPEWVDPRLVQAQPGSLAALVPPVPPHGYAVSSIQRLGGCTGDSKHAEISNVGLAFSQSAIAREICAVAPGAAPAGTLAQKATALVERIWSRAPRDGEIDALVAEMQQCISAGQCADAGIAARWLCRRLLDSAEFSTY